MYKAGLLLRREDKDSILIASLVCHSAIRQRFPLSVQINTLHNLVTRLAQAKERKKGRE